MAIRDIETKLFRVPLREVLVDAAHGDHTHFELVTVTITTEDGRDGTGYTYTGGKGGRAIFAVLEHDLAPRQGDGGRPRQPGAVRGAGGGPRQGPRQKLCAGRRVQGEDRRAAPHAALRMSHVR